MSKAEIFFDAITGVRPELVEEALDYRFTQRSRSGRRYVQAAACLALVALVGLAALRTGIVSGGSSADNAACDMSTDTSSSPQESESSTAFGDAPDSSSASDSGEALLPDTDSKAESGVSIPGESVARFTATVLEVHETYLLVEPEAGESIRASADRVEVPLTGLEDLWDIQTGERVAVTWAGMLLETYPAQLSQVLELVPAE